MRSSSTRRLLAYVVAALYSCCCLVGVANAGDWSCFAPVNFQQTGSMRCWAAALVSIKMPCSGRCNGQELETYYVTKHRAKNARVGADDTLDKYKFDETMKDEAATGTIDLAAITQGQLDDFIQTQTTQFGSNGYCMQFMLVSYYADGKGIGHARVIYGKTGDTYNYMDPGPGEYKTGAYADFVTATSYTVAAFAIPPCKCPKMCCKIVPTNPVDEVCVDATCSNCCVAVITPNTPDVPPDGGSFQQTKKTGLLARRRRAKAIHRRTRY